MIGKSIEAIDNALLDWQIVFEEAYDHIPPGMLSEAKQALATQGKPRET